MKQSHSRDLGALPWIHRKCLINKNKCKQCSKQELYSLKSHSRTHTEEQFEFLETTIVSIMKFKTKFITSKFTYPYFSILFPFPSSLVQPISLIKDYIPATNTYDGHQTVSSRNLLQANLHT